MAIRSKLQYTQNYGLPLYGPDTTASPIALNDGFMRIDNAIHDAASMATAASEDVNNQNNNITALQQSVKHLAQDMTDANQEISDNTKEITDLQSHIQSTNNTLAVVQAQADESTKDISDINTELAKMQWQTLPTVSLVPSDWVDATINAIYRSGDSVRVHITSSAATIAEGTSNLAVIDIPNNTVYGTDVFPLTGSTFAAVRAQNNNVVSIYTDTEYTGSLDMWIILCLREGD